MNKLTFISILFLICFESSADVFLGKLSSNPILERTAYVTEYDYQKRIPRWVFYTVAPDYLKTPPRKGKFKKFRADPDIENPVVYKDYTHSGYSRGHLTPFFTSGGDRDGDEIYAGGSLSDPEDEKTVFEINYMSNITPQDQKCFNGAGGVWYNLETHVRKELVQKQRKTVHIFAGPVFYDGNHVEYIGPSSDIAVPHAYFKILAFTNLDGSLKELYSFLFPHNKKSVVDNSCILERKSFNDPNFAVSIDKLETLTGLDFFSLLIDQKEEKLEKAVNLYK